MKSRHLLLFGFVLALLFVVIGSVSASQAYAEGISLQASYPASHGFGSSMNFVATKQVDGNWRQTTITIQRRSRFGTQTYTGVLAGDADGLEVSRDLGWGALNGVATLVLAETGVPYTFEFHLTLTATQRNYTENPTTWYFERPAAVEGVILRDGEVLFTFPVTAPNTVNAVNFSDQWPGY